MARRAWFVAGLLGTTALTGGAALADSTCPSGQFLRAFGYPSSSTCASPPAPAATAVNLLAQPNFSGSVQTSAGTISANSSTLTLGANDFQLGQGLWLAHAGASYTLGAPASCTVAPQGTPGGTTYIYQVSAYDAKGGVSAYVQCSTTTGNATLGLTNYNKITVASVGGAAGYALWGAAGSTGFLAQMSQLAVNDEGNGAVVPPAWLPTTAPLAALPDALITTVQASAGTGKVTLANAATNAVSGALVLHDDTAAAQAAIYLSETENLPLAISVPFNVSVPLRACSASSCQATLNISGNGAFDSIIYKTLPNFDVIYDNSLVPAFLRGFGIGVASATANENAGSYDTAGSGLNVTDGNHVSDRFENLNALNLFNGFTFGAGSHISGMISSAAHYAFSWPQNVGDSSVTDMFANPVTTTGENAEGFHATGFVAGIKLMNFKCLAGTPEYYRCIDFNEANTDGGVYIGGAWSIEGFLSDGIYLSHTNSATLGTVEITGSGDLEGIPGLSTSGITTQSDGTTWLTDLGIGPNIAASNLTNGLNIGGVAGLHVGGLQYLDDTNGIVIDTHSTNCIVKNNIYNTVTTPVTDGSSCILNAPTNTLSGDVALNNVSNYFAGPSIAITGPAAGTTVTWEVTGQVTLTDTAGAATFACGIYDGSSFFASAVASIPAANAIAVIPLSARVSTSRSPLAIYCRDASSTSGKILHNQSGLGFDSQITLTRIDN